MQSNRQIESDRLWCKSFIELFISPKNTSIINQRQSETCLLVHEDNVGGSACWGMKPEELSWIAALKTLNVHFGNVLRLMFEIFRKKNAALFSLNGTPLCAACACLRAWFFSLVTNWITQQNWTADTQMCLFTYNLKQTSIYLVKNVSAVFFVILSKSTYCISICVKHSMFYTSLFILSLNALKRGCMPVQPEYDVVREIFNSTGMAAGPRSQGIVLT